MEAAAGVTTMYRAAAESAAYRPACDWATTRETAGSNVTRPATRKAGSITGAAGEVARTVVAVRRAGVWVLSVIAVGAYWRSTNVAWTADPDAYSNPAHPN